MAGHLRLPLVFCRSSPMAASAASCRALLSLHQAVAQAGAPALLAPSSPLTNRWRGSPGHFSKWPVFRKYAPSRICRARHRQPACRLTYHAPLLTPSSVMLGAVGSGLGLFDNAIASRRGDRFLLSRRIRHRSSSSAARSSAPAFSAATWPKCCVTSVKCAGFSW